MTIRNLIKYKIYYNDNGYICIVFQNESEYMLSLDKNYDQMDLYEYGLYNLRIENSLGYEILCKKSLEKIYDN